MLIVLCKNERYKPISSYHADSSIVCALVSIATLIASVAREIDTFLAVIHCETLITPQVVGSFRSRMGPMLF